MVNLICHGIFLLLEAALRFTRDSLAKSHARVTACPRGENSPAIYQRDRRLRREEISVTFPSFPCLAARGSVALIRGSLVERSPLLVTQQFACSRRFFPWPYSGARKSTRRSVDVHPRDQRQHCNRLDTLFPRTAKNLPGAGNFLDRPVFLACRFTPPAANSIREGTLVKRGLSAPTAEGESRSGR